MQKLVGLLILTSLLFSSCSSSKYYFKIREGGKSQEKEENAVNEPSENTLKQKTEKDAAFLFVKENRDESFLIEKPATRKNDNYSSKEKKSDSFKKEKKEKQEDSEKKITKKELRKALKKRKSQKADFDWQEFWEIVWETGGALVLIALGLVLEGTFTWALFFGYIAFAVIAAVVIGFLLWLLFHNFVDGIRDYRSGR